MPLSHVAMWCLQRMVVVDLLCLLLPDAFPSSQQIAEESEPSFSAGWPGEMSALDSSPYSTQVALAYAMAEIL